MSINLSDAESSFLYGRAEFNKWADEFYQRWYKSDETLMMATAVKDAQRAGFGNDPAVLRTEKLLKVLTGRKE